MFNNVHWNPGILTDIQNQAAALQPTEATIATGTPPATPADQAMTTQWTGLWGANSAAAANVTQSQSFLNTAAGSVQSAISIVQQLEQLSTQAANDTWTGSQRQQMQFQANGLIADLNALNQTTWNTIPVFLQYAPHVKTPNGLPQGIQSVTPTPGWTGTGSYTLTLAVSDPTSRTTTTPHTTEVAVTSVHTATGTVTHTSTSSTVSTSTKVTTSTQTSTQLSTTTKTSVSLHTSSQTSVSYSTSTSMGTSRSYFIPASSSGWNISGNVTTDQASASYTSKSNLDLYGSGSVGSTGVLSYSFSTGEFGTVASGQHLAFQFYTPSGGEENETQAEVVMIGSSHSGNPPPTYGSLTTGPINTTVQSGAAVPYSTPDYTYTAVAGHTQTSVVPNNMSITWEASSTPSAISDPGFFFYGMTVSVEGTSIHTSPHTSVSLVTSQSTTTNTSYHTSHTVSTSQHTSIVLHTSRATSVTTSSHTSLTTSVSYVPHTSYTTSTSLGTGGGSALSPSSPVATLSLWQGSDLLSTTSASLTDAAMTMTLPTATRGSLSVVVNPADIRSGGNWSAPLQITSQALTLQTGVENGAANRTTIALPGIDAKALGLSTLSLMSASTAQSAITSVHQALDGLTRLDGSIGSNLNRLNAIAAGLGQSGMQLTQNLATPPQALTQAISTLSQHQWLMQSGIAMILDNVHMAQYALSTLG